MNPKGLDFGNDYEKALFYKHFAPYLYISDFIKEKEVLELGCGAGYGIDYISKDAKRIVTVDFDIDSISHAKENSDATNIEYIHQDILDGLKFEEKSFDIVISFQVIEHFTKKDVQTYLMEIYRLLRHGGIAFITTPNREIRLLPFQRPVNKYHPHEYSYASLDKLIKHYFHSFEIFGLRSKEEIEEIFTSRKKMSAFHVYVVKPIRRIVVRVLKLFRIKVLLALLEKRSQYTRPYHSLYIGDIKSDYFRFERNDLRKALDFLLVCKKI